MKNYLLLGSMALGLFAFAPAQAKAEDGIRVFVDPGYQQERPHYDREDGHRYYRHADEYRWRRAHRWHHRHHDDRDYDRDRD